MKRAFCMALTSGSINVKTAQAAAYHVKSVPAAAPPTPLTSGNTSPSTEALASAKPPTFVETVSSAKPSMSTETLTSTPAAGSLDTADRGRESIVTPRNISTEAVSAPTYSNSTGNPTARARDSDSDGDNSAHKRSRQEGAGWPSVNDIVKDNVNLNNDVNVNRVVNRQFNAYVEPYGLALAPMVRIGTLPTRLLSLHFGARAVWGPEIVDRAIVDATRVVDPSSGVVHYLAPAAVTTSVADAKSDASETAFRRSIFSCHPLEKPGLIFQLGSATPELAGLAAAKVSADISGIGLNCGCPKPFSTHGGMGAALLREPERLCSVLRSMVRASSVPVDCKIRVLPSIAETHALIEQILETGITCLTVHCRTERMRPREPAMWGRLPAIAAQVAAYNRKRGTRIILLANGDVAGEDDIEQWEKVCRDLLGANTGRSGAEGAIKTKVEGEEGALVPSESSDVSSETTNTNEPRVSFFDTDLASLDTTALEQWTNALTSVDVRKKSANLRKSAALKDSVDETTETTDNSALSASKSLEKCEETDIIGKSIPESSPDSMEAKSIQESGNLESAKPDRTENALFHLDPSHPANAFPPHPMLPTPSTISPPLLTGAMIGRAAEANPSCFRKEGLLDPISVIVPLYTRIAILTGNSYHNTKYVLNAMDATSKGYNKAQRSEFKRALTGCKTYEMLLELLHMENEDQSKWKLEELLPGIFSKVR